MPVSRRSRSSRTTPPVGIREERGGRKQNKHEEKWNARFKELLNYRSEHGDCNVPTQRGKLGTWVSLQRSVYLAGSLARGRIDRLNSIGFNWAIRELAPWETRFDELVQYKAKHGDCNIPQSQGKLGSWVKIQREVYKKNKLSPVRVDRLNGIGFKWALKEAVPTVPWETRFNEFVQYKAKHNNCNVPKSQGPLGRWVNTQREVYQKNKLSQDRIDRLNDIGFDWTPGKGRPNKRKALPITQELSSLDKESVSLLDENVESVPVVAGTSGFESNRFKVGDCASGPALLLPATSSRSRHNLGTESDDEVDEIGALIYDQVMQRRQAINAVIQKQGKSNSTSLSSNLSRHSGKSKDGKHEMCLRSETSMRPDRKALPDLCVSNAAAGYDCETDSEVDMKFEKSEGVPIKTEEMKTDDESS